MKLVTFSQAQAPHGVGDTRLVSDEKAAELQAEGVISSAEPWPGPVPAHPPRKPKRETRKPERPQGAGLFDRRLAE